MSSNRVSFVEECGASVSKFFVQVVIQWRVRLICANAKIKMKLNVVLNLKFPKQRKLL